MNPSVQHHPPQQIERLPARACAYLRTMSDSELALAIECIELNSTTSSLVEQQQPELAQQPQVFTVQTETDTSPSVCADASSRGITTITQKHEAVLAAMNEGGEASRSAPSAPPKSQDHGLGSIPIQFDQQQRATGPKLEAEEEVPASGRGQGVPHDVQGSAPVAMEVDVSSRVQEHAQYDVNHVLSELAAPVPQRRRVRPAPQVVYVGHWPYTVCPDTGLTKQVATSFPRETS